MKNCFRAAWDVWRSYKGFWGKFKAVLLILIKGRDYFKAKTGIWLWMPFEVDALEGPVGVDYPQGVNNLAVLRHKLRPMDIKISKREPVRINVMVPDFNPNLVYGGYIALFNFVKILVSDGYRVRFILCDDTISSVKGLQAEAQKHSLMGEIVNLTELVLGKNEVVKVNPKDQFVAYSTWTAFHADQLARETNGKPFIFFIQENETVFYKYDSLHALCSSAYNLNHHAIFNSSILKNYFQSKKMSVFREGAIEAGAQYASFEHALSEVEKPEVGYLDERDERKVIFYARPEDHAARNLFEIGVLALRKAINEGVFSPNWKFYGIGTLSCTCGVDLGKGHVLEMLERKPLEEYQMMLKWFDLGVALMYAPHPSVPPFEMAAAGVPTVVTLFEGRDKQMMLDITENFIPAQPTVEDVCEALRKGVAKAEDSESRVKNAYFEWPCNWDQSFNEDVMMNIKKLFN
jgi:hypothetical protein